MKNNSQNNSLNEKVIKEIASYLNLKEDVVQRAVNHFFIWQRDAFNDISGQMFLWNYFGTFQTIDKYQRNYFKSKQNYQYLKSLGLINKDTKHQINEISKKHYNLPDDYFDQEDKSTNK